jgi:hypothetical protein
MLKTLPDHWVELELLTSTPIWYVLNQLNLFDDDVGHNSSI